jgi:hypothetical protein
MPDRVGVLTVPDADRAELERRAGSKGAPARVAERARIVLLAAAGLAGASCSRHPRCPPGEDADVAYHWWLSWR